MILYNYSDLSCDQEKLAVVLKPPTRDANLCKTEAKRFTAATVSYELSLMLLQGALIYVECHEKNRNQR